MNSKLIMMLSALLLTIIGIGLSFMPEEIAAYADMSATSEFRIILQLLGALYFAFGMLNWMAKGSRIGGIYNRPIAIANFTHFFIGAMALIKGLLNAPVQQPVVWISAGFYSLFAVCFGIIILRHPLPNHIDK